MSTRDSAMARIGAAIISLGNAEREARSAFDHFLFSDEDGDPEGSDRTEDLVDAQLCALQAIESIEAAIKAVDSMDGAALAAIEYPEDEAGEDDPEVLL